MHGPSLPRGSAVETTRVLPEGAGEGEGGWFQKPELQHIYICIYWLIDIYAYISICIDYWPILAERQRGRDHESDTWRGGGGGNYKNLHLFNFYIK